jgi:hypothetical protein
MNDRIMMAYDAERLKKQAQEMIEKFYGYVSNVKITNVETKDEQFFVLGTFQELGKEQTKSFTMKLDKYMRLHDFSVK